MLLCPSCQFENPAGSNYCSKCRLVLQKIPDFTLSKLIGQGGFASVYQGYHEESGYPAAIKVLHRTLTAREDVQKRFLREAEVLLHLNNHHVVKLYDFGMFDEGELGLYLAMEWCNGETLTEAIEQRPEGRFSTMETRRLFPQLLRGLDHIHAQNVIHRDIKPSNLMLIQGKKRSFMKILDFGLVWIDGERLTQTGTVLGSLRFMAPEQFKGKQEKFTPATDLYAAGLVLAWMLTGSHVFSGDSLQTLAFQHIQEKPPSLKSLCPEIEWSPALEELLAKALEKDPSRRFQSAKEFITAFHRTPLTLYANEAMQSYTSLVNDEYPSSPPVKQRSFLSRYLIPILLPLLFVVIAFYALYYLAGSSITPSSSSSNNTPPSKRASFIKKKEVTPPAPPQMTPVTPQREGRCILPQEKGNLPEEVVSFLGKWCGAWQKLSQKQSLITNIDAFESFYHSDFRETPTNRDRRAYVGYHVKRAQNSSWIRVEIENWQAISASSTEVTLKIQQKYLFSTLKAAKDASGKISGKIDSEKTIQNLYLRRDKTRWTIWRIHKIPHHVSTSPISP